MLLGFAFAVGGRVLPRLSLRRLGVSLAPIADMKSDLTFLGGEGWPRLDQHFASAGAGYFHSVSIAGNFFSRKALDNK